MSTNPHSQSFNPDQISEMVGCPKSTVLREIKLGKLRAARINQRVIVIYRPDYDEWLRSKFGLQIGAQLEQLTSSRASSAGRIAKPALKSKAR